MSKRNKKPAAPFDTYGTSSFPQFVEIDMFPPFVRNDHVIERFPGNPNLHRAGTVVFCVWDDSMGAHGEWAVYVGYYPRREDGTQNTDTICYTWTSPDVLEKMAA